jgi:hypothetical protein
VLLLGLVLSVALGAAAAIAAPSEAGRPWWHSDATERVTGTVVDVDAAARLLTLDGLVAYDPVRAGIGTLDVVIADGADAGAWAHLQPGDTVDVEVHREDGRWVAESLTVLDPD